ncbi:uncharacterized protein G2W53_026286 [Senna tora]|uniref:Uncharacterized protein n=1 Tax=Senna tora TaxID=362788 RepID=A0A834TGP3_9FABA|nr:uncharacterized protein G2W53_026286 [Senna tora]
MENQKMNASSISAPSSPVIELGLSITLTRMESSMRVNFDDLEILDSTEESQAVLEKAMEIFIEELSLLYDFLADFVPMDPNDHYSNVKEEHCGIITAEEVTNSVEEVPVMNVGNVSIN